MNSEHGELLNEEAILPSGQSWVGGPELLQFSQLLIFLYNVQKFGTLAKLLINRKENTREENENKREKIRLIQGIMFCLQCPRAAQALPWTKTQGAEYPYPLHPG
jgi:hypothetical protein